MEPTPSSRMLIGFGNIVVKLKDDEENSSKASIIGAHGYCTLSIIDNAKFRSKFGNSVSIVSPKIRKNTIDLIKQLCSKSLSDFFADNNLTYTEAQSKISQISKYILDDVSDSTELELFGLKITELELESLSVSEPDDNITYEILDNKDNKKINYALALSFLSVTVALIIILSSIGLNKKQQPEISSTVVTEEISSVDETTTTQESTTSDKPLNLFQIKYGETYKYGCLTFRYDFDGWCICECDEGAIDVVIPEEVKGAPVYRIDKEVFSDMSELEHIKLPSSLLIIADNAFHNCGSLREIVFPENLKFIEDSAFNSCSRLKTITIPDSVISIGNFAFESCSELVEFNIPASVTRLGNKFVGSCQKLKTLTVDENNTVYYGSGNCVIEKESKAIIAGCNSSIIPNDGRIKVINESAFELCGGFKNIKIPEGVERIEFLAFGYCFNLRSVTIPKTVTFISSGAFNGSFDLETLVVEPGNPIYHCSNNCIIETNTKTMVLGGNKSVIPDDGSVVEIGDNAFERRDRLTTITVPEGVTKIGDWAFSQCYSLISVYLPSTLTDIGIDVFKFDDNLLDIYYNGTEEDWNKIMMDDNKFKGITIHFLKDTD